MKKYYVNVFKLKFNNNRNKHTLFKKAFRIQQFYPW